MAAVSSTELKTIITDPEGAETLVRVADQVGRQLKDSGLTTSQIRALFGEVRQIEAQWSMGNESRKTAGRRLILLKPKMAYRARRASGRAVEELVSVLDPALDQVIQTRDPSAQDHNFKRFVEFFEAILAYHKAYGGN
ncbi:MAG: type III-A CRISPR-associated protein Csm2 [Chloroflexota bacterium]|nr:type III-A CRISPR-associated protein Csm2 [Chloroflexota bacterium]